jgi:hypothetical protein
MLIKLPEKRIKLADIANHPWMKRFSRAHVLEESQQQDPMDLTETTV